MWGGRVRPDVKLERDAIHEKFESQINTAEAKLNALKVRAKTAKVNFERKAITDLLTRKQEILQKLHDLKNLDGGQWEQAKADFESRIADLQKSLKEIESNPKAD
jgi:hypothetical protein